MAETSGAPKKQNKRPERVTDLLYQGGVHSGLWSASSKKTRYFILNVSTVVSMLGIEPTNMKTAFTKYPPMILTETKWAEQVKATYNCGHSLLQRKQHAKPRFFEQAVTIIFVLEKYAKEIGSDINVYDYLRIIPAHYFIDDFDKDALHAISKHYEELSVEDRTAKFGQDAPEDFETACLQAIDQPPRGNLIKQLSWGMCVSRYVADHVRDFINSNFPSKLHVGRVLASGQTANWDGGGTKGAASELKVPKTRAPDELQQIPLPQEPKELDSGLLSKVKSTDPIPVSPTIVGVDWVPILVKETDSGAGAPENETEGQDLLPEDDVSNLPPNGDASASQSQVPTEASETNPDGDEPAA